MASFGKNDFFAYFAHFTETARKKFQRPIFVFFTFPVCENNTKNSLTTFFACCVHKCFPEADVRFTIYCLFPCPLLAYLRPCGCRLCVAHCCYRMQMSYVVSQSIEKLSALCSTDIPPLSVVFGHASIMWDIVCGSPQSQRSLLVRPHFLRQAKNQTTLCNHYSSHAKLNSTQQIMFIVCI